MSERCVTFCTAVSTTADEGRPDVERQLMYMEYTAEVGVTKTLEGP